MKNLSIKILGAILVLLCVSLSVFADFSKNQNREPIRSSLNERTHFAERQERFSSQTPSGGLRNGIDLDGDDDEIPLGGVPLGDAFPFVASLALIYGIIVSKKRLSLQFFN